MCGTGFASAERSARLKACAALRRNFPIPLGAGGTGAKPAIPHSPLYFDTHTHLPDDCTDEQAETIIGEAAVAQVPYLLLAGTSLRDCPQNLALAATHAGIYTSVGIHPLEVQDYDASIAIPQLRAWLACPHVVAIGEIGLDNHYEDSPPPALQEQAFIDQLRLAAETGTPVVIHSREAFPRCHELVGKYLPKDHPLQIHSFADGPAELEQWLKLNTIFSYNGMVTFKKAENIRETLRLVPLDRLVLETDAPYLAPVPFRGQPNASRHIPVIARRIAEERQLPLEELARLATANARRFFRV